MLSVLIFDIGHYVYFGLAWIHYVAKDDPDLPAATIQNANITTYIYLCCVLLGMEPGIMHAKQAVYQLSYTLAPGIGGSLISA